MQLKLRAKFIRMSPRKMRYVIDMIRGKSVPMAFSLLDRLVARACTPARKLLEHAVDVAVKQKNANVEDLYVSAIYADGAGIMKRFRAMSMGRAGVVRKRFTHLTIEVSDRHGKTPTTGQVQAKTAPRAKSKPVEGAHGAKTQKTAKKKLAGAAA